MWPCWHFSDNFTLFLFWGLPSLKASLGGLHPELTVIASFPLDLAVYFFGLSYTKKKEKFFHILKDINVVFILKTKHLRTANKKEKHVAISSMCISFVSLTKVWWSLCYFPCWGSSLSQNRGGGFPPRPHWWTCIPHPSFPSCFLSGFLLANDFFKQQNNVCNPVQ